jgi:hypothetical protein
MPSLAEAYDRRGGAVGRRRLYLGTGLFAAGALLVLAGIAAGATPALASRGFSVWETREIAGVLAGLGVPAVFLGVFTVLPASAHQRAAATLGAGVAVVGVALFRTAYPGSWYTAEGVPTSLTLLVVGVYFVGTITTFWYLFTAVATFKRRNDPGGTVTMEFSRGGHTRTLEVAASDASKAREALGGVAVFGDVDDPDGEQTPSGSGGGAGAGSASPASDGGATTADVSTPGGDDGELIGEDRPDSVADRYCGNCRHFDYVRTEDGIQPYCGFHAEEMDDVEACPDWEQAGPEALR